MTDAVVKAIIAALAQPGPFQDLSILCPDKKELTKILLELMRGSRSTHYRELLQVAEARQVDVHLQAVLGTYLHADGATFAPIRIQLDELVRLPHRLLHHL